MDLPPKPKFEKVNHHVVPGLWQRRFAAPGDPGPYYLNVKTGQTLNAQGPGEKMSEQYVNIVFDEFYRPSDAFEDRLSKLEAKIVRGLDSLLVTGVMNDSARVDIAMLLALQSCRYPERFSELLDYGKYLAVALTDYRSSPSATVLNGTLRSTDMLAGASLTEAEFNRLQAAREQDLTDELSHILQLHGYEAHFNANLIINAAQQVAGHLLGLHWKLLHSTTPKFILSDRPVPSPTLYSFSVGLSASYGLILSMPETPVTDGQILPQPATQSDIETINRDVRARAQEWICGPGSWVHQL